MLDFQVPRITAEEIEDNKGSFTVEPLDRGFGYTFGNSLRRVLLSSLVGAAVTSVRIDNKPTLPPEMRRRSLHRSSRRWPCLG